MMDYYTKLFLDEDELTMYCMKLDGMNYKYSVSDIRIGGELSGYELKVYIPWLNRWWVMFRLRTMGLTALRGNYNIAHYFSQKEHTF